MGNVLLFYVCGGIDKYRKDLSRTKEVSLGYIDKLIEIVMSSEIREYDRKRWWGEDALASFEDNHSHVSYLSILAWMMGEYKELGGGNKYDELYGRICYTLNRRMLDAEI